MNVVIFLLNVLIVVVVSGGPAWKDNQRGGGLKVGQGGGKNADGSRGNGLRVGGGQRIRLSTTTFSPVEEDQVQTPAVPTNLSGLKQLHVGIVLPSKSFGVREYTKASTFAKHSLQRKLKLFKEYDIQVHINMKELTPSPTCT